MEPAIEPELGDDDLAAYALGQELQLIAGMLERAGFRAAGILDSATVARMMLIAHELGGIAERAERPRKAWMDWQNQQAGR
ncbi:hypothetical protein [Tropicibacter naphthalenivorans]|nr:hypothetical protein [Tropicibacter naphthalenivorans]